VTTEAAAATPRDVYDAWHARHDVDAEADAPWHLLVKARLDPARDLAGRRVLEIACGRGGFACWLARHPARPAEVVAADFSPTAVAKAEQFAATQGVAGVRWVVADIQELAQFGPEFDTVISCETVEHVPDPPRAVRELARVLKPGGRLFLTTPNYLSTMGLYRAYCWVRGKKCDEGGQPICQLTMVPKTRNWMRAARLRLVETSASGQYLPFPGRPPIRLEWLERRGLLIRWLGLHSLVIGEKAAPRRP
jgi:2-polyprenyl-3-methyl-5-hydroxy-6-metoxy-1,4-benzoquinol methylase